MGEDEIDSDVSWGLSASSATIICSDCTRNGKTLFAKLAADLLTLRKGKVPFIFDTDNPDGSLLNHFPGRGKIVNLARTDEHVGLFDGMLSSLSQMPEDLQRGGGHFLIDLSTRHLKRFFNIFREIDFQSGANETELDVSIFFLIDRKQNSIAHAAELAASLSGTRFIPVRNAAFGDVSEDWQTAEIFHKIPYERELLIPELSAEALGLLEHPEFHFDAFVAGRYEHFSFELKAEMWGFLESLYEQRKSASDRETHPL